MEIPNIPALYAARQVATEVKTGDVIIIYAPSTQRGDEYLPMVISKADLAASIGGGDPGYKEYVAILNQSGTNAPVATILKNTLGGVPAWSYDSVGYYPVTLAGAFAGSAVTVTVGDESGSDCYIKSFSGSFTDDTLNIFTSLINNPGGGDDDMLQNTSITIRVYP